MTFFPGTKRPICAIAADIQREWSKVGKGVNYAAKPYLQAMGTLVLISDTYGADSGRSIVLYFLANAQTFKGDKAKALKLELKNLLK